MAVVPVANICYAAGIRVKDLRDGRLKRANDNRSADMSLDPEFLSRLQFAWVVGWHILLPAFTIGFGMGVVTGIVMPFQFGTNWSRFSDVAGNIISPLLAYEGLMAFFLESTFLGVLLFGRKLVPPAMHFVAAVLVAVGTLSSAFWIL